MKRKWATIAGFTIALGMVLITGCGQKQAEPDIKQMVHDYSMGILLAEDASITSHQLIVNNSGKKTLYDLPEDEFFVSIAPYVEKTHPCAIHSLTGCRGELVNTEIALLIKDLDGNTIMDQTVTTQPNGFIDLWLPRDKVFLVTMTYQGMKAESEISTFKDDNTCITTMRFADPI